METLNVMVKSYERALPDRKKVIGVRLGWKDARSSKAESVSRT